MKRRELIAAGLTPTTVTVAGLVVNALLALLKVLTGVLFYSQAILADGMHSASDLLTDLAVLAGLRVSDKPPDSTHHYGHRRVSTLVAMFVAMVLLIAAGWITYNAVVMLHRPVKSVSGLVPFYMAIASVPVKELLYQVTRYAGTKSSNVSVIANAWHHRTDALTSIAAAAGLAGVAFGGAEWAFLDPLTALVLAAFLGVVAVKIMATSASELIDRAPSGAVNSFVKRAIAENPGVLSYHAFRARQLGGKVAMDIHIQVSGDLTVRQGHEIAGQLKRAVMAADCNVVEVIIHVEPAGES